ncbi:MAG: hypothetical protein IJX17_04420 [Clostridia bacterium]|nr:hypothetical protein [Clostridia bacterium]
MDVGKYVIVMPNGEVLESIGLKTTGNHYVDKYIGIIENNKLERDFGEIISPSKKYNIQEQVLQTIDKTLIEQNIEVLRVKTPSIFEIDDKLLKQQELFGLAPFVVNEKFLLPPASDFGIFKMLENTTIDNANANRFYEIATCYRKEDSAKAFKRQFVFGLPDFHSIKYKNDIKSEILLFMNFNATVLRKLNIKFIISLRITEDEYENQKDVILKLAKDYQTPISVNILPSTIRYWTAKYKLLYMDSTNSFIQLSTVQVDYSTCDLFSINGGDTVIHSSPGSLERLIYAVFDNKNREVKV